MYRKKSIFRGRKEKHDENIGVEENKSFQGTNTSISSSHL